ncbi:DUF3617 domain-containing protein [Thiobacillus sp.]
MRFNKFALLLLAGLSTVLAAPNAFAADAPMRKSGLWEIKTETSAGGQKMPGPMTMQMCIDQRKDDMTADPRDAQDMRKRCTKMDVKRTGNKVTIDSVCAMDGHTATGRSVITGNMATDYRMENTTRFDPPMQGMQTLSSTMTGKWLGPCKPGQQHGSVTMSGMGPGGEFRMDPEMMKRMQQMQQQYGR